MNKILLFLIGCYALNSHAQQSYETGVVIDSIAVSETTDETFALFLPSAYKAPELSSILFVFSPSGNGRQGVTVFQQAAEEYNYIVVCSNNARNGSYERNFAIAERLFDHIFANFGIREKGIYLAGFSGGSRLVTAIATLTEKMEGVIACGAGFSQIPYHKPSTQKFSYAGVCGERDMNYQEMVGVRTYLNQLRFGHTLFTFDGAHRWPPQELILQIFEWLELESVKKGHLEKSKAEILKSYRKSYASASEINFEERPLRAYERYERLLSGYKPFFTLDSIANKMQIIRKSSAYSKALDTRNDVFEQERDLANVFVTRFQQDYEKSSNVNMKWWVKKFEKLDKLKSVAPDREMENMLSRFRYKIYAMVYEKQQLAPTKPNAEQIAFCKELYALIYPKPAG